MSNKNYPRGKLNKNDHGATTVMITSSKNTVIIQFQKSVNWLGLSSEEACAMGHALIKTAMEMKNVITGNVQ
jgi:hypothetical protein